MDKGSVLQALGQVEAGKVGGFSEYLRSAARVS